MCRDDWIYVRGGNRTDYGNVLPNRFFRLKLRGRGSGADEENEVLQLCNHVALLQRIIYTHIHAFIITHIHAHTYIPHAMHNHISTKRNSTWSYDASYTMFFL